MHLFYRANVQGIYKYHTEIILQILHWCPLDYALELVMYLSLAILSC